MIQGENELILESLNEIAKAVADGTLSDSSLIKANGIYKLKTNFLPDSRYNLIKAKTFSNFMNDKVNPQILMKALVLGDTKVMNGITYVVKLVGKSGKLDWRLADKKPKVAGATTTPKKVKVDVNKLFDTKDFPDDILDLTFIKQLGGSTGAVLVKDKNGNEYVHKKGASSAHVEEEFLTNCMYKIMGIRVPEMKLFDKGGKASILSKYMPNTTPANNVMDELYIEEISEGYVMDCLLANWDAYKNDNILVDDDNGGCVRVDNGGGLRFSAQGRDKGVNFSDDVDEIETMLVNNMFMAPGITNKGIFDQIKKISKNKAKLLAVCEDDDLRNKLAMRIGSLEIRLANAQAADNDPYRELTEEDLEKALKAAKGDLYASNDLDGWVFLSQIAKLRGYNGKPTVVDAKTFESLLKDEDNIHINRGITGYGNKTAGDFMNDFVDSDHCFYGKIGMYGAGIYGAVNKEKKNHKGNSDYNIAYQYSDYQEEHIMDVIITPDMKVIDAQDLENMMIEEFFGDDFKNKKKEYDDALELSNKLNLDKDLIEKQIEIDVKKNLGWDEKAFKSLKQSRPDEVYADVEKFQFKKTLNYFTPIINRINGTITKIDKSSYEIELPNSGEKFILSEYISSDPNALKQKNEFSTPYNYQYRLLRQYLIKEHFGKIQGEIKKEVAKESSTNKKLADINTAIKDQKIIIGNLANEVASSNKNGNSTLTGVMADIAKKPSGEFRGFYGAIKGYDAIIQKNGWGGSTDFAVILNRSKLIVKDFNKK